jgi:hypothetical protein
MSFHTSLVRHLALSAFYSFAIPLTSMALISMAAPAYAQGAAVRYNPTPAPRISDPTLEPIAADEPIPPAAFPPIPDRLNLGNAIATSATDAPAAQGSATRVNPTFHQGYGHVPAGAYIQQRPAAPSNRPPSATPNDSYNVNTGSQASPRLPELPTPVTVSQSTTQDLSLPDDEFSDYHKKRRNGMGSYAGNMMRGYMFGAAGMATGIGLGSLRY